MGQGRSPSLSLELVPATVRCVLSGLLGYFSIRDPASGMFFHGATEALAASTFALTSLLEDARGSENAAGGRQGAGRGMTSKSSLHVDRAFLANLSF